MRVASSGSRSQSTARVMSLIKMYKALRLTIASAALLFLLAGISFADPQFPQAQGMLNDFAGKLSPGSKQQIEALLQGFKGRTGIEISVVTVAFDDMQGYPIEQYTLELGRITLHIVKRDGHDRNLDTGSLFE